MKLPNQILLFIALLCAAMPSLACEPKAPDALTTAISEIRSAALETNPKSIAHLLSDDLALISQSGKLYGKEAVLFDLGNGFARWENSEVVIRRDADTAIVTLVNERTRTGMKTARFRVMQVWRLKDGNWQLSAQSSARIPE